MLKIHFTPLNYREINQPETIAVLAEINHYKGKTDWEYFCLFIDEELDPGKKKSKFSRDSMENFAHFLQAMRMVMNCKYLS